MLLALTWPVFLPAQSLRLVISPTDQPAFTEAIHDFRFQPEDNQSDTLVFRWPDTTTYPAVCSALLQQLYAKAYLSASLDSLQSLGTDVQARLYLGPRMHWVQLRTGITDHADWLRAAGYRPKVFSGKLLRYDALLALQRALLEQAENHGYPFASIGLDSIVLTDSGQVSAVLQIKPGQFFTFQGIKIVGDVQLPAAFLPNYLGLRAGSPYSRAKVLRLREQLRTLLFVDMTGNPSVTFSGQEATVNLFLQKKRASRFDFLIGLLPQPNSTTGKLLVTGSLSAAFQNALNLGEHFAVEFERLRPETQKLDVQAGVPYLFGTPFGLEGRLNIFKRDSTWVDAQSELGVQYLFTGTDYVKFFWENKSSILQKVDTLTVLQSRRLPPNLDLKQNGFGLETGLNRLDYRFNPRRGWDLVLKTVAGFNTVQRNSQIESLRDPDDPDFRFSSLYDTVAGRVARFRLEAQTQVYLPVFARSAIKIGLRGGGIFSEKKVFANEQYRLGGTKLLRGFDEESLFATRFAVATAEFRLLIGPNSYLAAFGDYGYLENITNRTRVFLRPLGLGVGLNFETKAGIFGISVAAGRRDVGQGVDLRATKFHLGYVSLF
ncbi:MAG: BamA/TamA family outer membrane protein [Saprospiraceae bacterium]